jgi:hypothetical protein
MPKSCDMGRSASLPLRKKARRGFFHPKIPTASAGFEPAKLGTRGKLANHYTTEAVYRSPLSLRTSPGTNLWWRHAVAQLVEALRHKPEGRGIDSRWCHANFSLTLFFRAHYGPGVDSASNRNEY